jgi:molybdopterin-guanine dinucleotide biosynthesis protein A
MRSAGLLLTGGLSRRMGVDKASIRLPPHGDAPGETLAERTARLLEAVTKPALEVGPGHTHLPVVMDRTPGAGPLAAVTSGSAALRQGGWRGPVLVLATDLPRLSATLLAWLAEYPSDRSVVPTSEGHTQALCARYAPGDLETAAILQRAGASSMHELLDIIDPVLLEPEQWLPVTGDPECLTDVDDRADLERLGWGVG